MAQAKVNKVKEVNKQVALSSDNTHQSYYEYDNDPLQQFTSVLRAPETKRQYPRRLKVFMDFVKIEGDLRQQEVTKRENTI